VNTTKELWYVTRGSGAVALVLLTGSVALGVLTSLRASTARLPRFAVGSLHRNLTLLAILFVVLHVVTTVADGYAPIGLLDGVVPFASPYRPIWLGLGTVAFDLVLALVATSYLRMRIGARAWRSVHWLAYAAWPVALVHSLGTGSDARATWLVALAVASVLAVAGSVAWRIVAGGGLPGARLAAAAATVAVPVAIAAWYEWGPAQDGWAKRAGTPVRLIASRRPATRAVLASARTPAPTAPRSFDSRVSGTIRQVNTEMGDVRVIIRLTLADAPHGKLRIDLRGTPLGSGVSMNASGVSFVPATTRAVYFGRITGLDGSIVAATVKDAAGDTLQLTARLALDTSTGRATGMLAAVTP
jgi:DMSO/TMAO reductase YedYZ heme-binding membrane subunit